MQRLHPLYFLIKQYFDGLTKLPFFVIGMLAHGHGDERYAYYGLDLNPHDANHIVG